MFHKASSYGSIGNCAKIISFFSITILISKIFNLINNQFNAYPSTSHVIILQKFPPLIVSWMTWSHLKNVSYVFLKNKFLANWEFWFRALQVPLIGIGWCNSTKNFFFRARFLMTYLCLFVQLICNTAFSVYVIMMRLDQISCFIVFQ